MVRGSHIGLFSGPLHLLDRVDLFIDTHLLVTAAYFFYFFSVGKCD